MFIPFSVLGLFFLLSMVLALFDTSYSENAESLLANKRARYRLALAASFRLLLQRQENEDKTDEPQSALSKQSFLQLMEALGDGSPFINNCIFDLVDADGSGAERSHLGCWFKWLGAD